MRLHPLLTALQCFHFKFQKKLMINEISKIPTFMILFTSIHVLQLELAISVSFLRFYLVLNL